MHPGRDLFGTAPRPFARLPALLNQRDYSFGAQVVECEAPIARLPPCDLELEGSADSAEV